MSSSVRRRGDQPMSGRLFSFLSSVLCLFVFFADGRGDRRRRWRGEMVGGKSVIGDDGGSGDGVATPEYRSAWEADIR